MRHLFIIQNGLHGSWRAMKPVKNALEKMNGGMKDCDIYISTVNDRIMSRNGIKECGTRLVQFIENIIVTSGLKNILYSTISFITHSFGGLIARYAIGLLYANKLFNTIRPLMYVSVATPHLGILNEGRKMKHKLINFAARHLAGKTGKELMLLDREQILVEMSTPNTIYSHGLESFARKYTYSNISGDSLVAFRTSAICLNEYQKISINNYLFKIIITDTQTGNAPPKNKLIHEYLTSIEWTRKAVNLNGYCNIHRAIIGNTVIPFLPSLFSPDFRDNKYIVIGDIIKQFNKLCAYLE